MTSMAFKYNFCSINACIGGTYLLDNVLFTIDDYDWYILALGFKFELYGCESLH